MDWHQLLSTKRLGVEDHTSLFREEDRSQFQRDYDRIIFSAAFRRLQNKTQVFPLPGKIFVHNRLTHTLEVASVGRSLGHRLAEWLFVRNEITSPSMISEIGSVVSAACLAHDLGNPPFGHSGESAIANYFMHGHGSQLSSEMSDAEWKDFTCFDGNANAFRLLTHAFKGKRKGGFALTYTTLASIVKYPFESSAATKQKLGFFQSEKNTWLNIAGELQIPMMSSDPLHYVRHPLVYLVEAADDICYQIMDVEDAFKLGILSLEETKALFMAFSVPDDNRVSKSMEETFHRVSDPHEQVSYLRAGAIGRLTHACFGVFTRHYSEIMEGRYQSSLLKDIPGELKLAMERVQEVSVNRVYNHRTVVEIEVAGYRILGTLMDEFIDALRHPGRPASGKLLQLMPEQYHTNRSDMYAKVQTVVDFIAGMTDVYALDLYRKIKGISLPEIG